MIAFIEGELVSKGSDHVVVSAGGIGYFIQTSASSLGLLAENEGKVRMYTYLSVREDGISLFGFVRKDELDIFRLLIQVNGIGPKAALSILSVMTPDALVMAIAAGDTKAISKSPGVGSKTAGRIILDLRDKVSPEDYIGADYSDNMAGHSESSGAAGDVIMALTSLGYGRTEAVKAVMAVPDADSMDSEALLKQALRRLI